METSISESLIFAFLLSEGKPADFRVLKSHFYSLLYKLPVLILHPLPPKITNSLK